MKLKKTLSGMLAVITLLLGSLSTLGSASAYSIETNDIPIASGASLVETKDIPVASAAVSPEELGTTNYNLCNDIEDGVILHAWCWSFDAIRGAMSEISNAGYTAIQTSPVNMVNSPQNNSNKLMGTDTTWGTNGAWWWQYQPTDYKVGNFQYKNSQDTGNKLSDYKDMCDVAHSYGIKIITDVVLNHTAKNYTTVSDDLLKAVGIKTNPRPAESSTEWYKLYHENWNATSYTVNNVTATGRLKDTMWNLECGKYQSDEHSNSVPGLRDLNTENPKIQEYMLNYMNDLVDAGCDGFRFDTTKHIAVPSESSLMGTYNTGKGYTTDFWPVMTGQKSVNGVSLHKKDDLFLYGEILDGDDIPYGEYADYVKITADVFGQNVRNALKTSNIHRRENGNNFSEIKISNDEDVTQDEINNVFNKGLITWVESHDTYCNNNESAGLTAQQIEYGWAIIAARKTGTPLFFSRPNNSTSSNIWGDNIAGARGNEQYKSNTIKNINNFRNQMAKRGADNEWLRNPVSGSGTNTSTTALQIDRFNNTNNTVNSCGTCIINIGSSALDLNGCPTSLADGTYTDTISGNSYSVSSSKFTSGTVAAGAIATIYNTGYVPLQIDSTPISDTDLSTYKYTYFFNSLGWSGNMYAALSDDSETNTQNIYLRYSSDLHCYYCKYPVAPGYTKITFKVGSNSTTQEMINPGKVFVPTASAGSGEWISINDIYEHTIYLNGTNTSWHSNDGQIIYAKLKREAAGTVFTNTSDDNGEKITPLKEKQDGQLSNAVYDFGYTYYFPKTSKFGDLTDYSHVKFHLSTNRDTAYNLIDQKAINKYLMGSSNSVTFSTTEYSGALNVNIKYYNQKAPETTETTANFTKGSLITTSTSATVSDDNVENSIVTACREMNMTNVYDSYTFFGSQFSYVKALASDIDPRLSTTEPRAAFINPANLAKASTAFSGVYTDDEDSLEDMINVLNSASDGKWIEYKYNGTALEFSQVNPSIIEGTSVNINAYCQPQKYVLTLCYPTETNSSVTNITGTDLYVNTTQTKSYTNCVYNQLYVTATDDIKSGMEIPEDKYFDGWYEKSGNKYLKISSEMEYKYRITGTRTLYALFRDSSNRPAHKATAIADPIDVFSENGTTMYRYNTLLNICDLGDSDSNITDVGIVYVKPNTGYSISNISSDLQSHISSIGSYNPTDYEILKSAVYAVGDGTNKTVTLTTKNRLQFNLKLTNDQAATGNYKSVLAFTVYKYSGTWHVSENCVHYIGSNTGSTFTEIE